MLLGLVFDSLRIDKTPFKWVIRFMFAAVFILTAYLFLSPFGDSDFSALISWMNDISDATVYDAYVKFYSDMPLTDGNILYIFQYVLIAGLYLFTCVISNSLYIRAFLKPAARPSVIKVILRSILLTLFLSFVILLLINLIYYAAIFILPILAVFSSCYVSGDFSFGRSFKNTFKFLKRAYFPSVSYSFFIVIMIGIVGFSLYFLSGSGMNTALVKILTAAFLTYSSLIAGRASGINYIFISGPVQHKKREEKSS